jgi:predicted ATP-grasp superfamily ATP-dependent carboligase
MAVVMGDVDMVRALGLAGIPSAYYGPPESSARFSRHVQVVLPWIDEWHEQDKLVAALLRFAQAQDEPPVLYPQTDGAVLLASRRRDELGRAFRFVLADAELIEQLIDKHRFQALAERRGLPVPPAQRLRPRPGPSPPVLDCPFPVIVKPVRRGGDWTAAGELGKALCVRGDDDWAVVWPRLAGLHSDLLVQQLVSGPESAIDSYHAYIDESGATAGEFTGRKIRTFPPRYGYSTAVKVIDLPDVAELGREVLATLDLRGVAKVDFKRDDRGRLHLLEVNPRFSLWLHPGAVAGVNLPALVHADLSGAPRPRGRRPTRQVIWCTPLQDLRAAYLAGIQPLAWLRWARGCQAMAGLSRDDPLPFVRGAVWGAVRRRLTRRWLLARRRATTGLPRRGRLRLARPGSRRFSRTPFAPRSGRRRAPRPAVHGSRWRPGSQST